MKPSRIAVVLAVSALLSACAYLPPPEGPARQVSLDYAASGDVMDARAYLYGKRTVLEFAHPPSFLIVKDENGLSVDYEKVGRHYRLARKLDHFTAWINGRALTFSLLKPMAATTPMVAPARSLVSATEQSNPTHSLTDRDLLALLRITDLQLQEARQMIKAASEDRGATGAQLYEVEMRLRKIQARLTAASSAMVRVGFPTGSTIFRPSPDVEKVLASSARIADRINIRGRTDAFIAGPADPKIASGRAIAARNFLVKNGVDPDKITISSQAEGDFVVPGFTRTGKAMNRRVEIEVVHNRIAYLQNAAVQIAER